MRLANLSNTQDSFMLNSKKKYYCKFLSEDVILYNKDKKIIPVFKTEKLPVSALIFWGIGYKVENVSIKFYVLREGNNICIRSEDGTYNKEYRTNKAARNAKFKLERVLKNKSRNETKRLIKKWLYSD